MDVAGLADFGRRVSTEGAVLLKNDNNILPVRDQKVSVFGRTQINYYKSGTGSGGAVNARKTVNILEGLRQNPHIIVNENLASEYERLVKENVANYSNTFEADFSDKEIEIEEQIIKQAREFSEKAIIIIGRVSGEAYDNSDEEGSFLLTCNERRLLGLVTKYFEKTAVIINSGNIIDVKWINEYNIPSVMLIWQGGQYGGKAVADLISGDVTPSGKLADTIAYNYTDYPSAKQFGDMFRVFYTEDIYVGYRYFETFDREKVVYPFGYGLSYTNFSITVTHIHEINRAIDIKLNIKNIGYYCGKEVVQVYFGAPQGKLGKPLKSLIAFKKTKNLYPGQTDTINIKFNIDDMSSYDDSGITGNEFCYVMEKGDYDIYIGNNVRDACKIYTYHQSETQKIKQCEQAMAPVIPFERLKACEENGVIKRTYEPVSLYRLGIEKKMQDNIPKGYEIMGDRGIKLIDVYEGKWDLKEFISQLTENELASIVRGEGMLSPKVTPGTASCFGGVTDRLIEYGIPSCCTADGPSGIRMDCNEIATSLPCGTLQACTWNPDIIEEMYAMESIELDINNIDAQLGPGMNIHRNPLCGRNFEYFSEDPLLSGIIAASVVKGIQNGNCSATIKHFACNNQEYERNRVEAVVSERALREIYLKGFEITVKTAAPKAIMTSYNPINGKWSASNYDLTTSILRKEWGFDGMVMTDWWALMNKRTGSDASMTEKSAMVRAQNDVYMCVENFKADDNSLDDIIKELENRNLTIGELQRSAENILGFILKSDTFAKTNNISDVVKKYPDMALIDDIKINGKSIENFCPYVMDYFSENINDIQVEVQSGVEYEINKIGDTCEIIAKQKDKQTIYKVIQGFENSESEDIVSDDLGDFFVSNNCSQMCDICAKPGTLIKYNLHVKQSANYNLYLYVSSYSTELTQLSIFAFAGGNKLTVSLCGTNGEWKEINMGQIYLHQGSCELELEFGISNFADINMKKVQFIREGN